MGLFQVLLTFTDYWFIIWATGEHYRSSNRKVRRPEIYSLEEPNLNLYLR